MAEFKNMGWNFKPTKLVFLVILAGLVISCGSKEKKEQGRVIPAQELVPVLEDIYLADGIFSLRYLREKMPGTDSMSNYRDILKKYGYTLDDLNKTIDHYTSDTRMNELQLIYEQVVKDLRDTLEKTFEEEHIQRAPTDTTDLWPRKREFHLPREGQRNKIPFNVPLRGPGVYSLTVKVKVAKEDGSKDPYIHVWFWKRDGTPEGKRIEWAKRRIPKDGRWHQFILARKLTDPSYTHLKGYLLDDENKDKKYIKRADIKGLKLYRRPLLPEHDQTPIR